METYPIKFKYRNRTLDLNEENDLLEFFSVVEDPKVQLWIQKFEDHSFHLSERFYEYFKEIPNESIFDGYLKIFRTSFLLERQEVFILKRGSRLSKKLEGKLELKEGVVEWVNENDPEFIKIDQRQPIEVIYDKIGENIYYFPRYLNTKLKQEIEKDHGKKNDIKNSVPETIKFLRRYKSILSSEKFWHINRRGMYRSFAKEALASILNFMNCDGLESIDYQETLSFLNQLLRFRNVFDEMEREGMRKVVEKTSYYDNVFLDNILLREDVEPSEKSWMFLPEKPNRNLMIMKRMGGIGLEKIISKFFMHKKYDQENFVLKYFVEHLTLFNSSLFTQFLNVNGFTHVLLTFIGNIEKFYPLLFLIPEYSPKNVFNQRQLKALYEVIKNSEENDGIEENDEKMKHKRQYLVCILLKKILKKWSPSFNQKHGIWKSYVLPFMKFLKGRSEIKDIPFLHVLEPNRKISDTNLRKVGFKFDVDESRVIYEKLDFILVLLQGLSDENLKNISDKELSEIFYHSFLKHYDLFTFFLQKKNKELEISKKRGGKFKGFVNNSLICSKCLRPYLENIEGPKFRTYYNWIIEKHMNQKSPKFEDIHHKRDRGNTRYSYQNNGMYDENGELFEEGYSQYRNEDEDVYDEEEDDDEGYENEYIYGFSRELYVQFLGCFMDWFLDLFLRDKYLNLFENKFLYQVHEFPHFLFFISLKDEEYFLKILDSKKIDLLLNKWEKKDNKTTFYMYSGKWFVERYMFLTKELDERGWGEKYRTRKVANYDKPIHESENNDNYVKNGESRMKKFEEILKNMFEEQDLLLLVYFYLTEKDFFYFLIRYEKIELILFMLEKLEFNTYELFSTGFKSNTQVVFYPDNSLSTGLDIIEIKEIKKGGGRRSHNDEYVGGNENELSSNHLLNNDETSENGICYSEYSSKVLKAWKEVFQVIIDSDKKTNEWKIFFLENKYYRFMFLHSWREVKEVVRAMVSVDKKNIIRKYMKRRKDYKPFYQEFYAEPINDYDGIDLMNESFEFSSSNEENSNFEYKRYGRDESETSIESLLAIPHQKNKKKKKTGARKKRKGRGNSKNTERDDLYFIANKKQKKKKRRRRLSQDPPSSKKKNQRKFNIQQFKMENKVKGKGEVNEKKEKGNVEKKKDKKKEKNEKERKKEKISGNEKDTKKTERGKDKELSSTKKKNNNKSQNSKRKRASSSNSSTSTPSFKNKGSKKQKGGSGNQKRSNSSPLNKKNGKESSKNGTEKNKGEKSRNGRNRDSPPKKKIENRSAVLERIIGPLKEYEERLGVVKWLNDQVFRQYGLKCYLYGSVALGTFLPLKSYNKNIMHYGSDIDVTILKETESSLFSDLEGPLINRIEKILKKKADIYSLQVINSIVPIIKCSYKKNFDLDISYRMFNGLVVTCLFQEIDDAFFENRLLKKSICIVKYWAFKEDILASVKGNISSYGFNVMILHFLWMTNERITKGNEKENRYGKYLENLFLVLEDFITYFSTFDFSSFALHALGKVKKNKLPINAEESVFSKSIKETFRNPSKIVRIIEVLRKYRRINKKLSLFQNTFWLNANFISIIDPVDLNNNLGLSMQVEENYNKLKEKFLMYRKNSKGENAMMKSFKKKIMEIKIKNDLSVFDRKNYFKSLKNKLQNLSRKRN